MSNIKTYVFDAYGTLFDVFSVTEKCEELFPGNGNTISQTWRKKQLEYSYLRQMMGKYRPFSEITRDALRFAVAEANQELSTHDQEVLLDAYRKLKVYEEAPQVLKELNEQGVTLAIFSNGSHDMLDPLVEQSSLSGLIDYIISADDVKQYKPTPASYTHVLDTLEIKRDNVLFMSSNGWDISGAQSFGFHTAWINRKEQPVEELNLVPNSIYNDLTGLRNWKKA